MKKSDEMRNDPELDLFFDAARQAAPMPSDAVMARILADAAAVQPVPPGGFWPRWLVKIGGLPALGGLVSAACVGFWLGVAPPATLPDFAGHLLNVQSSTSEEYTGDLADFGWDVEEG